MKNRISLFASRCFLALGIVSHFSCSENPVSVPVATPAPPKPTYTLSGRVTFPDGTPIDSAAVKPGQIRSFGDFDYVGTDTDSTGHYAVRMAAGAQSVCFLKGHKNDKDRLRSLESVYLPDVSGDTTLDVNLLRKCLDPTETKYKDSLTLYRYPLTELHFGTSTFPQKLYVEFLLDCREDYPDFLVSWTAYKIPPGVSWSTLTASYLERCGTPKTQLRRISRWTIYPARRKNFFRCSIPCTFFVDCPNGIAFVSDLETPKRATFEPLGNY